MALPPYQRSIKLALKQHEYSAVLARLQEVSFNQVVMSISRTLLYFPLWTVIPLPEREDDDACLSPMPE
jgi:hypothetical protein